MEKQNYPEWALKYKAKGTTLRKKGRGYALIKVTSRYVKGSYPRLVQEYLGMVTEDGFAPAIGRKSGPSECGLTAFVYGRYHRDLCRCVYGVAGERKEAIVKLGCVLFAHGSVAKSVLSSCALTKAESDGLAVIASSLGPTRLKTVANRIASLMGAEFPGEEGRELIALLRMERSPGERSPRAEEIVEGAGR